MENRKRSINKHCFKEILDFPLSIRSACCLMNFGIEYIGELIQVSEKDLLGIKNFGPKSLSEINVLLTSLDLELNTKVTNWEELLYAYKLGEMSWNEDEVSQ